MCPPFQARQSAYSLLLNKGLIRISLTVPNTAQFTISGVQDLYSCPQTTATQPAFYLRPLPATNLDFPSAVMWDGRETVKHPNTGYIDLTQSLTNQATDATLGHAQATSPPTPQQLAQIVSFETALYTAQSRDENAGKLTAFGAAGGPVNLSKQSFILGSTIRWGAIPPAQPSTRMSSRSTTIGRT